MLDGSERNYLQAFYLNPNKDTGRQLQVNKKASRNYKVIFFCRFKAQVILSLLERYQNRKEGVVTIYERSVRAGKEIFLEKLSNVLQMEDLTFLSELAAAVQGQYEKDVVNLYLSCSNSEMLARCNKRDRPSEKNIQYVYRLNRKIHILI
jgi:deoxyadenosine/deoxycytidine kinase